jgi:hypothetical protein
VYVDNRVCAGQPILSFYTLHSLPTFPRPGPHRPRHAFIGSPDHAQTIGTCSAYSCANCTTPLLASTLFLLLDSYILPVLGGKCFVVCAPSGMHPLCETRRTQTFCWICCLSPAGYRLPSDDDVRDLDPSIVPAFPFLGLSVCFSRAFADGTRTSSTNPEASMWRFLSLCPPSVIRAKG